MYKVQKVMVLSWLLLAGLAVAQSTSPSAPGTPVPPNAGDDPVIAAFLSSVSEDLDRQTFDALVTSLELGLYPTDNSGAPLPPTLPADGGTLATAVVSILASDFFGGYPVDEGFAVALLFPGQRTPPASLTGEELYQGLLRLVERTAREEMAAEISAEFSWLRQKPIITNADLALVLSLLTA